jgi:hypothetical protein
MPDVSEDTRPQAEVYNDFLPIHTYALDTGNIPVYDGNGQQYSGRFISGASDLCVIRKIYSDGWCYVSYPSSVEADGYAEAYVPWSTFAANAVPENWESATDYTTYRRSDLSETLGSIDAGDICLRVSREGALEQVIYPITGTDYFKMGWIVTRSQSGIRLASLPEKRSYELGQTLNLTGLEVQAVYDDGSVESMTGGYTVAPTVLTQTGAQTIVVTCGEYSATFTVNVACQAPVLTLNYPSLSFEDEILYNVYYSIDNTASVVEMGLMTFATRDANGTVNNAVDVIRGCVGGGGDYMVQSRGIPAKNLGDALYFKVYAKLTDGSYAYSDVAG